MLIAAAAILSGCGSPPGNSSAFESPPAAVRCAEASTLLCAPSINSFGTVLYHSKADVYPTTEGYIESLYAGEGDYVIKGERLARLRQEKLFIERDKTLSDVESKKSLLRLSDEKLKEGRIAAEKTIISIEGAAASLKQKTLELENMKRIYGNKKQLFDAGGLAPEELESVRMSYLNTEYEYEKSVNDFALVSAGYRDEDIISAGYSIPEDPETKKEILVKINTSILEAEKGVAQAQLDSAVSELKRIDLLIKETVITSPISGTIGRRNLDIGEKVTPEKSMFTVFQSEKVFVRIEVEENRALGIKKGDEAELFTDTVKSTGMVHLISPMVNPETRSREIKIIASNSGGNLVPGSFIRVRIRTAREREETVVPEKALVRDGAGSGAESPGDASTREAPQRDTAAGGEALSVFIVREGKAFRKAVRVSYIADGMAVIADGIKPGEIVCIDPPRSLREGKEVTIIK